LYSYWNDIASKMHLRIRITGYASCRSVLKKMTNLLVYRILQITGTYTGYIVR